ncbi:MAG: hypothetical protein HY597_04290 [Candidatus Omnitrophica bacterium]|nr:hypothetical protein [Candidatus Omnitrophota bacterium]
MTRKGQSLLEYLIVLAAVIVLIGLAVKDGGVLKTGINALFQGAGDRISSAADKMVKAP